MTKSEKTFFSFTREAIYKHLAAFAEIEGYQIHKVLKTSDGVELQVTDPRGHKRALIMMLVPVDCGRET